jgi:transposase
MVLLSLSPFCGHRSRRGYGVDQDERKRQKRRRRSFSDVFKAGAVRLVLDEGKTVAAVARDLGLIESSVRYWVEQARADRTQGQTGLTTDERAELAALRKDNRELRMERDILKKAAAFFAKNQA